MKSVPKTLGYPTKMLMEYNHYQINNDQRSLKKFHVVFYSQCNMFKSWWKKNLLEQYFL
jgi:hypothetical protein